MEMNEDNHEIHEDEDVLQAAQVLVSVQNLRKLFQRFNLHLVCSQPLVKILSDSDVNDGQDRLLLPKVDFQTLITPALREDEHSRAQILITIYTSSRSYPLLFEKRNDGKYVITYREVTGSRWRNVSRALGLNSGDRIKLWILRRSHTAELCFVIEKI